MVRLVVVSIALYAVPHVAVIADEIDDSRFRLTDVFDIEYASSPQFSPDGKQVVYVRNSNDIMKDNTRTSLWIVNIDWTKHEPLTDGSSSVSSPRWSPDGSRLAYVSSVDGKSQIHCRWIKSGQTTPLTNLQSSPKSLVWSRDGKQIAFVMQVPDKRKPFVTLPEKPEGAKWAEPAKFIDDVLYRYDGAGYLKQGKDQLFVLPAEGGTPRQITSGKINVVGDSCWTEVGQSLLFSSSPTKDADYAPLETDIYEVSVADRKVKRLTNRKGPDESPMLSPDGEWIAFTGFDDTGLSRHVSRLYVMSRDGSQVKCLTEKFDRGVFNPTWVKGGPTIYVGFDDRGSTYVGKFDLKGRLIQRNISTQGGTTIGRPYASGSFSANPNTGAVAFTSTTPLRPADIVVMNLPGAQGPRYLTTLNDDLFRHKELGSVEEFWYESSFDKKKIQGWIVKPPGFDAKKKYPLILEIHGGPFANYGPRFSAEIQLYAAAGYVVVYINPRGSSSYGQEFMNEIHHKYPGNDYDDLMSGVDAVIRKGYVDDKNLFVTGGSGGGILTAWIVGKTDRFKAAVSAKPVINWYSFVLYSDVYTYFHKYWFPDFPWNAPEHYMKRSPLSLVGNVKTPTMLLTGEVDHRTPIPESEQFYQALKLRKIDTALVRIPGASHAIASRPSRLIAKVAHILKWFEKYRVE
ncbi:MAG: peptidase S9 family protein [Planctomycetaceae bacterium]|nr:peptidase S9 family protein [Planctomycetaceae bacterium]